MKWLDSSEQDLRVFGIRGWNEKELGRTQWRIIVFVVLLSPPQINFIHRDSLGNATSCRVRRLAVYYVVIIDVSTL
jgi:hypothetical protein